MWFGSASGETNDRSAHQPARRKQRPANRRRETQRDVRRLLVESLEDRRMLALAPLADYDVGQNPQAVVTGDFNGDGRPDLAVANADSGTVSVLLGNTDGTFQPAISSLAGNNPTSLAVGDFNADGKLDLVTGDSAGYWGQNSSPDVTVLLGNGNGSFQAPTGIDLTFSSSYGYLDGAESVAVGDFNADGKLDFGVVSNYFWSYWGYYGGGSGVDGYAAVLLGTGTGTFGTPSWSHLGYYGYHVSAAVADFNADGKLDIATASAYYGYEGYINVALGTGTGTFGNSTSYYNGTIPNSIVAADLNSDGKLDLATATNGTFGSASVFLGSGTGSFGTPQGYTAGPAPASVAAADFNGDGVIDLITTNADIGTVSVLLGAGSGAFKPPVSAAVGSAPSDVAVGDFNGDGRIDVAATNAASSNVSVLLNDGTWPALDTPSLSINDVTVTEGNTGTVNATFTVSLSAASSVPVTVDYATVDSSATAAGGDYQAKNGALTFAPGETTKSITVLVNGDRLAESNESFSVALANATNAFVADAKGMGAITDDEPHVRIDGATVTVAEGNTGTTEAVFTVRLTKAYDAPVTVNYATEDGTATAASGDYQAKTGTVTFAPGETEKTITVLVNGDRIGEYDLYYGNPNEYFYVRLTGSNEATIDSGLALGAIVDDEPRVLIGSATVTEGNSGTTAAEFTVSLSNAYDAPVTVDYSTVDEGATAAGGDYQAKTGSITFAPGETTKTISVLVNGDRLGEYDEYFYVHLTGAEGALIEYGYGYGTILDDEPRISIDPYWVGVTEGNRGTKAMTFTVILSAPYDQTVTVKYATQDGSAKAGEDYVAASGTLTFAAGQTTKTFTVTIKGDKKKEHDEYFTVSLSDASSNAQLWPNYVGYGDILNDEGGKVSGKGKQQLAWSSAVDAAMSDWLATAPKKRGR